MPMLPIPAPILARFEAILEKRPLRRTNGRTIKNGSGIFWIFAPNIQSRRPDLNRSACSLISCGKKNRPRLSKIRPPTPYPYILKYSAKGQIPVADIHSNAKKPSIPEPPQVRERSPSFTQSTPPKTTSLLCRHSGLLGVCGRTAMPLNQPLRNGMPPSPSSQRRSKPGITPERRLKPTPIGHASFSVF